MLNYLVSHPGGDHITGDLHIPGSKSIHQRLLILKHLYAPHLAIENPSTSNDARVLTDALKNISVYRNSGSTIDIEDAGTPARLLLPVLAMTPGTWTLTGTDRMKQRPMSDLIDSLLKLGFDVQYIEKDGFLPIRVNGQEKPVKEVLDIEIDGSKSSQFTSAMVLAAPTLARLVNIHIRGQISSRPYLELSLELLKQFGYEVSWVNEEQLTISGGSQTPEKYTVESDWSSISYWFSIACLSEKSEIAISSVSKKPLQGDSAILEWITATKWLKNTLKKEKLTLYGQGAPVPPVHFNFTHQPDLAPTIIVMHCAKGIPFTFEGVESLQYKESDRLEALRTELAKFEVKWEYDGKVYHNKGHFEWPDEPVRVHSYKDHRIAMAFATLAVLRPVIIENIEVVKKSYPEFWQDLRKLKFVTEPVD